MGDPGEQSARFWDDEAAAFDEEPDHGLRDPATAAAWRDLLLPLAGDASRIADLGCGTGTLSVLFARAGHRVTGLDFSPEMVARARAKPSAARVAAAFAVGDAARPPLAGRAFDLVLSRHVLWAMPEPGEALDRWVALLAP